MENGIFTDVEIEARNEIRLESYTMNVQIDSRIVYDLAVNHIVPASINYQNVLLDNLNGLKEAGIKPGDYRSQTKLLEEITVLINGVLEQSEAMRLERKAANELPGTKETAIAYCDKVKPYTDEIRYKVDKLEQLVDDKLCPLPKYRELLFVR